MHGPESYAYLAGSRCYQVDGMNDAEEFQDTVKALKSVGIAQADIDAIMTIVGSILHLGNITFVQTAGKGGQDGSTVENMTALNDFAKVLKLDPAKVAYTLTHRELAANREGARDVSSSSQNPVQAADRRDALARSLYEKLFNTIVLRINEELDPNRIETKSKSKKPTHNVVREGGSYLSIGVLDIYGKSSLLYYMLCIHRS